MGEEDARKNRLFRVALSAGLRVIKGSRDVDRMTTTRGRSIDERRREEGEEKEEKGVRDAVIEAEHTTELVENLW